MFISGNVEYGRSTYLGIKTVLVSMIVSGIVMLIFKLTILSKLRDHQITMDSE